MLVLVNPWPRLLPGMPPLAPLAMEPSVGHVGSSTVRIRTLLNNHVPYILAQPANRIYMGLYELH